MLVPLLERGSTFRALCDELRNHGVEENASEEWATALLHQLAGLSLLEADVPEERFDHRQMIELGSLGVSLSYTTRDLENEIAPIFRHLEVEHCSTDVSLAIADFGAGLVQILEDGRPATLVGRDFLAIRLKGILVERVLACGRPAIHAALLAKEGQGILLLGSPGAGKSTLALMLLGCGYYYGSDDVALIKDGGAVDGVPLAPGLKEGAWPIAESLGAPLTPSPGHGRPDGQRVRFACIDRAMLTGSCRVGMIVNLHRRDGVAPERRHMTTEEALSALIRESHSGSGRCSVETMAALAILVRGASCFHLHYAEAAEAADLIAAVRKP